MSGLRYDDMTDKSRAEVLAAANRRWGSLSTIERNAAEEGLKYLLFVNSGAVIALLAFLDAHVGTATHPVCGYTFAYVSLAAFIFGIIAIGAFRVEMYRSARRAFKSWSENVKAFKRNSITDEEIYERDERDARDPARLGWLSGSSFVFFIIGVIAGTIAVLLIV